MSTTSGARGSSVSKHAPMAWAIASAAPAYSAESRSIPNIVLILADDLGWTDLGCFGSDLYQSPHIDRLAREGMKFTRSFSACTVCSPTRAAIQTGKYPARLHITDWIPGQPPENPKLLFERAKAYVDAKRNLSTARELLGRYLDASLTPDDPPRSEAQQLLKVVGST